MTTTPHDGRCHPYEHLPGCDCFDNPQERNPIQTPSLQEIQRREGVGAAEAMRRQAFNDAHGLRADVQLDPRETELIELRERIVELEAVVRYWKSHE